MFNDNFSSRKLSAVGGVREQPKTICEVFKANKIQENQIGTVWGTGALLYQTINLTFDPLRLHTKCL